MADNADQPKRSQDAKDCSRAQSRAVSGKEAARGTGGQRTATKPGSQKGAGQGQGNTGPAKGAQSGRGPAAKGGTGKGGNGKGPGQRPPRPGNRPATPGPRRPSTALLTWGIVGLVVVVVVVLVVVKVTSGSGGGTKATPPPGPLSGSIVHEMTNIPASVYNTVGVTSPTVAVTPPKVISGQPPLTFNGKPGYLYMGADYCPYCAAERWAIVAALSRFGTIGGLQTMQSSSTDVHPSTQTVTFVKATYTSQYISAVLKEVLSNKKLATGSGYQPLEKLTKSETALVKKYNEEKYTGNTTSSGSSIPFIDIGNKAVSSGASYTPGVLSGLTRAQIAGDLSDPTNPATKAIISVANYQSAAICSIDGGQPASVCTSKGVTAAAKALNLSAS
jgi:hypothetical protein